MDAKRKSEGKYALSLSLSEARDIGAFVDNFRDWDLIASHENQSPMLFMLQFGRDCRNAVTGYETTHYPIERGKVALSEGQLLALAKFIEACVNADGGEMSWLKRVHWKLAYKT